MATQALAFHLEGLAEDGEAVPAPSSQIMAIAENRDGVAVLIEAPAAEVKSVRVNIVRRFCGRTLHAGLLCDFSFVSVSSPHSIQRADPMVQVDDVLVVE